MKRPKSPIDSVKARISPPTVANWPRSSAGSLRENRLPTSLRTSISAPSMWRRSPGPGEVLHPVSNPGACAMPRSFAGSAPGSGPRTLPRNSTSAPFMWRRSLIPCDNKAQRLAAAVLFGDVTSRLLVFETMIEDWVEDLEIELWGHRPPLPPSRRPRRSLRSCSTRSSLLCPRRARSSHDLPSPEQQRNQELLDRFWSGGDTTTAGLAPPCCCLTK